MGPIFHITTREAWRAARAAGRYEGDTLETEGFIHLATREQLHGVVARWFPDQRDLVVLEVDPARLGEALRWEAVYGDEAFPHLYGPLPVDAVTAVHDLSSLGGEE